MKRPLVLAALLALTACTPAQTAAWLRWHRDDPDAAVAFLDTEQGQALLAETDDAPDARLTGEPGDCDSYAGLFLKYGLPVSTFKAIAWRESGCDHTSWVSDRDDLGGGLLGINLRAGASRWNDWCGLTASNVTDAETNVRCARAAYDRMGMSPWRT